MERVQVIHNLLTFTWLPPSFAGALSQKIFLFLVCHSTFNPSELQHKGQKGVAKAMETTALWGERVRNGAF